MVAAKCDASRIHGTCLMTIGARRTPHRLPTDRKSYGQAIGTSRVARSSILYRALIGPIGPAARPDSLWGHRNKRWLMRPGPRDKIVLGPSPFHWRGPGLGRAASIRT